MRKSCEKNEPTFLYCNNGGKVIKCRHSFSNFFTEWEIIGAFL